MSFPSTLEVNGNHLVDTKSIANAFNEYFTSVGPMLANSIQPGNRSFKDFLPPSPSNSFYLKPVTPMEVEDIISSLNPSKATGPYSIPVKILKLLKPVLSYHYLIYLTILFYLVRFQINLKLVKSFPCGQLPANYSFICFS